MIRVPVFLLFFSLVVLPIFVNSYAFQEAALLQRATAFRRQQGRLLGLRSLRWNVGAHGLGWQKWYKSKQKVWPVTTRYLFFLSIVMFEWGLGPFGLGQNHWTPSQAQVILAHRTRAFLEVWQSMGIHGNPWEPGMDEAALVRLSLNWKKVFEWDNAVLWRPMGHENLKRTLYVAGWKMWMWETGRNRTFCNSADFGMRWSQTVIARLAGPPCLDTWNRGDSWSCALPVMQFMKYIRQLLASCLHLRRMYCGVQIYRSLMEKSVVLGGTETGLTCTGFEHDWGLHGRHWQTLHNIAKYCIIG